MVNKRKIIFVITCIVLTVVSLSILLLQQWDASPVAVTSEVNQKQKPNTLLNEDVFKRGIEVRDVRDMTHIIDYGHSANGEGVRKALTILQTRVKYLPNAILLYGLGSGVSFIKIGTMECERVLMHERDPCVAVCNNGNVVVYDYQNNCVAVYNVFGSLVRSSKLRGSNEAIYRTFPKTICVTQGAEYAYISSGQNIEKYNIATGIREALYSPQPISIEYDGAIITNAIRQMDIDEESQKILATMFNSEMICILDMNLEKLCETAVCDRHDAVHGGIEAYFVGFDDMIYVATRRMGSCSKCQESEFGCGIVRYNDGSILQCMSGMICWPIGLSANRRYIVFREYFPTDVYKGYPTSMEESNAMCRICVYDCVENVIVRSKEVFVEGGCISSVSVDDSGCNVIYYDGGIKGFKLDRK